MTVTVYSKSYCPFCDRAIELLEEKKKHISFELKVIKLDEIENGAEKAAELTAKTGQQTVPMIFIGETFIGGFDDMKTLETDGKLESLLL